MAKVIELVRARYEVQDVEFGKVYKWRPERVVIGCECGETVALTASRTTCEQCGEEHTGSVREALSERQLGEKDLHPWRCTEGSVDDPPSWF